jgi:radical SAM superfamily enzyme YgiQ (UPF0313 family)
MTWTANARPDVDRETLKIMKRAGLRLLCVGVESGDQAMLDRIEKGITLDRIRRFFRDAKAAGVAVHGCFMVGNRGETEETMERTLQFAIELEPDTAQFFPLMVYPGTRAYDWAKAAGFIRARDFADWLTPEGLHNCVIELPGLGAGELVRFCDEARRRFYLRPRYVLRKLGQSMRSRYEAERLLKSFKTFSRYLFTR